MLKDNLFTIQSLEEQQAGTFVAEVALNAAHELFQGHFPGQPVLPGVCLLEMVKELLGQIIKKPCRLLEASSIKYLKVVDPNKDPRLTFEIVLTPGAEELKLSASSYLGDGTPNFKLIKARFV